MDGDDVRAPARASRTNADASWTLKLPFLCARPGNVGVQIDAFRTMRMFHRPRCGKFTEHFLGIPFENASMDNYARVLERTSKRARIVEDRIAKLRAREQAIHDDNERRQQRRREREVARQRKLWLHHQSLKKREQRQREDAAAVVIQRYVRGMLARYEREVRLAHQQRESAARTLQRSSKSFLTRKQQTRRALEQQKERQMAAATVLQRQTRKRLARARRHKLQALESPRRAAVDDCSGTSDTDVAATVELPASPLKRAPSPELDRHISLDLLFSDDEDEDGGSSEASPSPLLLTVPSPDPVVDLQEPHRPYVSPTQSHHRPKRPVSIKRVGGGFRATSFTPTKAVVPTRAYPEHHHQQQLRAQPPQRRFVTAAKRPQESSLTLPTRRPSVPSSPSTVSSSTCQSGAGARQRRSSADEALSRTTQCKTPPTLAAAAAAAAPLDEHHDENELVLEELLDAYARSHVADHD